MKSPAGIDTRAHIKALENAQRRAARIEVAGQWAGTGVLVAPDVLLTAAHVLPSVTPSSPVTDVVAIFDYHEGEITSPAETGISVPIVSCLDTAPPTADETGEFATAESLPTTECLDFALLRLACPIAKSIRSSSGSHDRGYYSLSPDQYAFAEADTLMIVHHPAGASQMIGRTAGPARLRFQNSRVRYRVDTAVGSSGAPLIDDRGRLVAIHHRAVGDVQQGVPVSAIAHRVLAGPGAWVVTAGVDDRNSCSEIVQEHLPESRPTRVGFTPGDPLPRLRRLSSRAKKSAGTVPGTNFDDALQDQFTQGLYVARDLECDLVRLVRDDRSTPLVVTGEPGAGKTSILWGMARRFCASSDSEVFFLKATWLVAADSGAGAHVDLRTLAEAVAAARRIGRAVVLLIDTVDVLADNDESWSVLDEAVNWTTAAGGSVIVTSRVDEAKALPSRWNRCQLSDYATEVPAGALSQESEFDRAVRAHSQFYTRDPHMRAELVTEMLATVARNLELRPLCLRPLTLRMLFEIYNPNNVYKVVDTTDLYREYWNHRVVCDRRIWDSITDPGDTDRDLSETAQLLGIEMLRTGLPEAKVSLVVLPKTMTFKRFKDEILLLVRRGVGQFSEHGVFQFFHQTFFEYAASRALIVGYGAAGIAALVSRALAKPNDYFLLAVLEQALLCAGKEQESIDSAVEVVEWLLARFARDISDSGTADGGAVEGGGGSASYGLRRVVLSVCAQSTLLCGEMVRPVTDILKSRDFDLHAVRDFLELLPAPGRAFGEHDRKFLVAAAGRHDNAWIPVIEVLGRLLPRDCDAALTALSQVELVERAVKGESELAHRGEFRDFLVELLLWDPEGALACLSPVIEAALKANNTDYVASVFAKMAELSEKHPDKGDWLAWADQLLGSTTVATSQLIMNHAALRICQLRGFEYSELIGLFTGVVDRLLSPTGVVDRSSPASITTADRSLFGAILTVAGETCSADADPAPFVAQLTRVTRREMISDLSRGWLIALLDAASPVGDAIRDLAVEWLAAGMPITSDHDIAKTRAKVISTALARLDLPLSRVADIAGRAATGWISPTSGKPEPVTVWSDAGCLLPLVVRGAAAGIPEAAAVLNGLGGCYSLRSRDVVILADPFKKHAGTRCEIDMLIDLLLRIGEFRQVLQLVKDTDKLDPGTLDRLRGSALAEFRAALPPAGCAKVSHQTRTRQRDLAKLLAGLAPRGAGLRIPWPDLVNWIHQVIDSVATGQLVELVGDGLVREEYPPQEVLALLRALCGAPRAEPLDRSSDGWRAARRWCVWWYAKYGDACHLPEMFRLAFTPPLEPKVLVKATNCLYPDRRGTPLTVRQSADVLLEMGRRLRGCGLGTAPRKDIAKAWRAAMWTFVPTSAQSIQLCLVRALPELDDEFAGQLVQLVSPSRRPEVLEALQVVAATAGIGNRLRGNANGVLDAARRRSSVWGRPDILKDLKQYGLPGSWESGVVSSP